MNITDKEAVQALRDGKNIKRKSTLANIGYYMDKGIIYKQTTDETKRHIFCAASFSLEDLTADDWEILEDYDG